MATNTIGATGDYATLAAWETARQGSSDATETATLLSEEHSSGCTLDGWTNTPDIVIAGAVTQDGDHTTGPRFKGSSLGYLIRDSQSTCDVTLRDFSVEVTGGYNSCLIRMDANYTTAGTLTVERCMHLATSYGANNGVAGVWLQPGNASGTQWTVNVDNCVFQGHDNIRGSLYLSTDNGLAIDVTLRGCTFDDSECIDMSSDHNSDVVSITAVGCLFNPASGHDDLSDLSGASTGTYTFTSTSNITADSSATHNANWGTVTNLEAGATFNNSGTPSADGVWWTDAANYDYSLQDDTYNIALGHVTTGTMPDKDILGDDRVSGSTDAGAFTIPSVGVTGTSTFTLPVATQSATGNASTTGEGGFTSPVPTQSASGELSYTATGGFTILVPTQSSSGKLAYVGISAFTAPLPTQSASGTAAKAGASAWTAPMPTQSSSGVAATGLSSTAGFTLPLPDQTSSGSIKSAVSGPSAFTLSVPLQSATGVRTTFVSGGSAFTLSVPLMQADGQGPVLPSDDDAGSNPVSRGKGKGARETSIARRIKGMSPAAARLVMQMLEEHLNEKKRRKEEWPGMPKD